MSEIVGYFISGLSTFIGFLVYERLRTKDTTSIATTLAILMTKVDSLLILSNDVKDIKETVIKHEQQIKNLQDTNRFAKLTEQILNNGGIKNE